jgi:hypothetical protein
MEEQNIKYAVLQEVNGEEYESWLYFIKYNGNEENLKHLHDQLASVEWSILDELSTFDLELEHLVSATTAKEMTKLDLNAFQFHRKFDGTLKRIDFKFKKKHTNEDKIEKVNEKLIQGMIDEYVSDEDIDPEDLLSSSGDEDDVEKDIPNEKEEEKKIPQVLYKKQKNRK